MSITKEQYKKHIEELLLDDSSMASGKDDTELIYLIDDIKVYGGFDYGSRGIDHWSLFTDGVSWNEVVQWGVIAVPETKSYICNETIKLFEDIGYNRLPLDNNHIIGWKG